MKTSKLALLALAVTLVLGFATPTTADEQDEVIDPSCVVFSLDPVGVIVDPSCIPVEEPDGPPLP